MMDWITNNWEIISVVVGAIITVFIAIAKKTKNKTDDKIAKGLASFWEILKKSKTPKSNKK